MGGGGGPYPPSAAVALTARRASVRSWVVVGAILELECLCLVETDAGWLV